MPPRSIYYCRYFELAAGVDHMDAPILNPRGDLGYMGFNTPGPTRDELFERLAAASPD